MRVREWTQKASRLASPETKMFMSDQGTDTIRAYEAVQVPYITLSYSTGDNTEGFDPDGDPFRSSSQDFNGDYLSMSGVE